MPMLTTTAFRDGYLLCLIEEDGIIPTCEMYNDTIPLDCELCETCERVRQRLAAEVRGRFAVNGRHI